MKSQQLDCLFILLLVSLTLALADAPDSGSRENRRIKDGCKVRSTRAEEKLNSPVDYKLTFEITNAVNHADVVIECNHRALGVPDWYIRVRLTSRSPAATADKQLIAGAILLAMGNLRRDYPSDPIRDVFLDPADMPSEFSTALFDAVGAQMKRLNSKARRFNDPRVRKMVGNAFRQMDYVQYIKNRLEGEGFTVKVDVAELCCLQRSVEGMSWKDIANKADGGLNVESATCCLGLERKGPGR